MNRFFSCTRALIIISGLIAATAFAASAPSEVTSIALKRTATSANPAVVSLSKNLFKTESYEAPYEVQVPYQATENYTVEIPYQTTEDYTVQVPYQTTEQYTESIPYEVSVPYTDYETDYRYENQCNNVTRYRNECHNEQRCYIVPGDSGSCHDVQECGTNALGQQICKTRQVCGGGSGPQQRCDNQQVCNQVPYYEQECHQVNVPYRREVTKYRNETRYRSETRTRTVTKHRTETRTREVTKTRTETRQREVTKYRTEEKCCVTKTRQVFDRQLQFQVSVNFPQNATLADKEVETLTVSLVNEAGQVSVIAKDTVYGYSIANQSVSGATVLVDLAIAPKYNLDNAGPSTIKDVLVDYSTTYKKHRITFSDSFKAAKVASAYEIVIADEAGNQIEVLAAGKADSKGKIVTRIATDLPKKTKIVATIKVKRVSQQILDGALEFSVVGKN